MVRINVSIDNDNEVLQNFSFAGAIYAFCKDRPDISLGAVIDMLTAQMRIDALDALRCDTEGVCEND